MNDSAAIARIAIGEILDGHPPNGAVPSEMGRFEECYSEMVRAYAGGGTEAARLVYVAYAEHDKEVAALRAGDPEPKKLFWSLADLYATEFQKPREILPGLLYAGLNGLGARPKIGKSWLALGMAGAVGSGGVMFGKQVEQGKTLYLALEDSGGRVKERGLVQKAPANATVDFTFEWPSLIERGLEFLAKTIHNRGYSLVIIDTISRALGRADQLDNSAMNVTFGELQRLALDKDIAILLIDHHKKGFTGDPIDDFLGATSKGATLDVGLGIYRDRAQRTATLKITGRDIEYQELAISFDRATCTWQLEGTAEGVKTQSVQADIIIAVEELGGTATVQDIAKWLGKDRSNIYHEVNELIAKGVLLREEKVGREVPYTLFEKYQQSQQSQQ